jgi:drug/metabolite transporter (DMT)-like permease
VTTSNLRIHKLKVLAAGIFWGASFVATKAALAEISPVTLIVLRFGIGVVILAFAVWCMRAFQRLSARELLYVAILGAIGVAIHQGLQANGLRFTTATSMGWLVALIPVFTAILAWFFLAEPMGALKILGLAIATVGAILVVSKGAPPTEILRLPSTLGDLLALLSALNWAIFIVASKPLLRRVAPPPMITYAMFIGWLLVLPFFFDARGWNEIGNLTIGGWLAVAFLGICCSGLAYIFYYDGLAHIDASQVASVAYLQPLITVVTAAIVLGEAVSLSILSGGAAILFGVYLVNRAVPQRAERGAPVAGD